MPTGDRRVDLVPVPGRHAARRRGAALRQGVALRSWWPETLRGRVDLQPAQVAVVALVVAVGLAVTTWWVVRSDATSVPSAAPAPGSPAPALVPVEAPTAASPSPTPSASEGSVDGSGATVTVDVAGKVRRPGIAVLAEGARVVDALDAAGGPRRGVDLTSVNLARPLVDGEQIVVGRPSVVGPAAAAAVPAPGVPGASGPALVNLNTADEAELDTLPEVGPVTAAAIIARRTERGGFTAVDELLEVDGIGEVTLARIAPLVTV